MEKELCVDCGLYATYGEEVGGDFVCEACLRVRESAAYDCMVDSGMAQLRGEY